MCFGGDGGKGKWYQSWLTHSNFPGVSIGTVQGLGRSASLWCSFPPCWWRPEAEKGATVSLIFFTWESEFTFYLYAIGLGRWGHPSGFQVLGTGAKRKESRVNISPTVVIFSLCWGHCLLMGSGPNSHWFWESGKSPTTQAQTLHRHKQGSSPQCFALSFVHLYGK